MDSEEGVCVDPGEKGAILEAGGPGPPAEEKGHSDMAIDAGDGLVTPSRDVYAQSECYCALYSSYTV
jgi:hypothetical protein